METRISWNPWNKMELDVTHSFFELQLPDFSWKLIHMDCMTKLPKYLSTKVHNKNLDSTIDLVFLYFHSFIQNYNAYFTKHCEYGIFYISEINVFKLLKKQYKF